MTTDQEIADLKERIAKLEAIIMPKPEDEEDRIVRQTIRELKERRQKRLSRRRTS